MFGRRMFKCTHVHGKVNMHDAIAQSCNVYFNKLAETTGMDRIAHVATEFGLGAKTGIGINPESPGRIPTRAWYALRYGGQFRLGFTLNMAIGQGATSVTPLQMALAYAAIGNGGTLYTPQVIRAVETSDGSVVQDFPPRVKPQRDSSSPRASRASLPTVCGAWSTIRKGTAYGVRDPAARHRRPAKTGTAQTGYVAKPEDSPKVAAYLGQTHAWFAAFSPARTPEIAVVVLIEPRRRPGPTQAAPIAFDVIVREYLRLQAKRHGGHAPSQPAAQLPATRNWRNPSSPPNLNGAAQREQQAQPTTNGGARRP